MRRTSTTMQSKRWLAPFRQEAQRQDNSDFKVYTADDQYHTAGNFNGAGPDFKLLASAFWSKTGFGIDTVRTGGAFNYLDFQAGIFNKSEGSAPDLNSCVDL